MSLVKENYTNRDALNNCLARATFSGLQKPRQPLDGRKMLGLPFVEALDQECETRGITLSSLFSPSLKRGWTWPVRDASGRQATSLTPML